MGAAIVKHPAPLDHLAHLGLQETLDIHIVYLPLVHFQAHHRYPRMEIHRKVAGDIPERQPVVVFLDGEENFRLIVAEQSPTPVECFVIGAGLAQDFSPAPEGTHALPIIGAEGADPL